jgi:hypothetical protein
VVNIASMNGGSDGSGLANAVKKEVTRRAIVGLLSNPAGWVTILAGMLVILLVGIAMAGGALGNKCSPSATAGAPTKAAADSIPESWMPVLQAAEKQYSVPWNVEAGIAKVETDFGRSTMPGVHSGANGSGASGPMQIGTGGAAGNTWGSYGVDADGDGKKDVYNVADAVFGAANYLRASGAPGDLHKAILAYNHAEWYYVKVMQYATSYAKGDFSVDQTTTDSSLCNTPNGTGDPDAQALIDNPNITFTHAGPELIDLRSGRISPRLIALLSMITSTHKIGIFALASDHGPGSNHEAGRGVDIWMVDGDNCYPPDKSGGCWQLAQELDRIQGCMHPTELIYYFDPGPSPDSFARADHDDHIHVGYDGPLGPKHYNAGIDPCSSEALTGSG